MGFFAKGLDGRIDDPRAGWKGKGLWATSGTRTPAHIEGIDAPSAGAPGKTLSSPLVVHFKIRRAAGRTPLIAAVLAEEILAWVKQGSVNPVFQLAYLSERKS